MAYRDEELANMTREDYEYRRGLLKPLEDELFGMKDDTSIIDNAREQVGTIQERGTEQIDRQMSRYGTTRTGAQAVAADRSLGLATAQTGTDLMNNATIDQEERNLGVLGTLVAGGRRKQQGALAGLGDVAGMESQRIAAGNQARGEWRAQRNQTIGTLATFAGFAMGM